MVETAVRMSTTGLPDTVDVEQSVMTSEAQELPPNTFATLKPVSLHKRKALTLETKAGIIHEVDQGKRQKTEIAKQYGISQSTLSTIYKNKAKILDQFKHHNITLKRVRTSSIGEVEEAVLRWYRDACSKNISVSGPMVKAKAKELAQVLAHNEFKASNGWLERFKSRNNITFKSGGKEKTSIGMAVVRDWQQHELPTILQQYSPRDIFVAGESSFLYHLLPDAIVKQKACNIPAKTKSQDRLTALFCCNMDGSEKEKLLLVGRFPSPCSFKGIKSLPVTYASDKRALMNAVLFEKWFIRFDEKMKWQQRKVLLFIHNCPAHRFNVYSQATEVRYLPPNTTMYHPLTQGIKQVTKCYYRRRLVQRAIAETNLDKRKPTTVKDAADMLAWAWDSVSPVTIMSCFRKSGFVHPVLGEFPINLEEYTHQAQALTKLTAAFLHRRHLSEKFSALEYIDIDEFLPICEEVWQPETPSTATHDWSGHQQVMNPPPPTPPDPVVPPANVDDEDNDDDKEECGVPPPKPKEVLDLVQSLRSYFQAQENVPGQVFSALASLEESALQKIIESLLKVSGLDYVQFQ